MGHACQSGKQFVVSLSVVMVLLLSVLATSAAAEPRLARGQVVYVPVYSNIFSAPKKVPYNLATMLSIRNTDLASPISITAADYYDTNGRLVRKYFLRPVTLAPLASTDIFIPEEDTAGGTGANFIIRWSAQKEVNVPIIESVMIGMRSGQGISFVSPGQEIRESGR